MSEDGILLKMNEDGTFGIYEPYCSIDFMTEEDFKLVKEIVDTGMTLQEIRNKAIDDFLLECLKYKSKDDYSVVCLDEFTLKRIAEQMKNNKNAINNSVTD